MKTVYYKYMAIGFGAASLAFMIATIVLAVQNGDLNRDIDNANDAINELQESLKTTTPQTTTTQRNTEGTTQSTTTTQTISDVTTTTTTTTDMPTTTPQPTINYRLPGTVIPESYNLRLNPNIDTGTFDGLSEITFVTNAQVHEIVLHSLNLEITDYYLLDLPTTTVITKMTLDTVREFLILTLSEPIESGTRAAVGLKFNGVTSGKIVGFYSSSYLKADGSRKYDFILKNL